MEMRKANDGFLKDIGSIVLNTTRNTVQQHENEAMRVKGIPITTSALYEAGVKDETIIQLQVKHWLIHLDEAQEYLRIEKTVEYPCRQLVDYLMAEEAITKEEADEFIINHSVANMLQSSPGLWKVPAKELYRRILEQKGYHA